MSNPVHPRGPRRIFRVPSIAAGPVYKPPSISTFYRSFFCSHTQLPCKEEFLSCLAWQPKLLNSLADPKCRDLSLPSLFHTPLPPFNHSSDLSSSSSPPSFSTLQAAICPQLADSLRTFEYSLFKPSFLSYPLFILHLALSSFSPPSLGAWGKGRQTRLGAVPRPMRM